MLKALQAQGHVKVLSKPYLYARNLQPVAIFSGKSVPYIASIQKTTTGTIAESTTSFTPGRAQDGVMMAVRCHIRDDKRIDVQIAPVLAQIDDFVTFTIDGNSFQNPISSIQQTLQSVTLEEGQTVVIGGLNTSKRDISEKAVPGISRIPLLGSLFKAKNDSENSTEIVITLKVRKAE